MSIPVFTSIPTRIAVSEWLHRLDEDLDFEPIQLQGAIYEPSDKTHACVENLYEQRKSREKWLEQQRRLKEAEELKACPFRPSINRSKSVKLSGRVEDRLYTDAIERNQRLEYLQKQKEIIEENEIRMLAKSRQSVSSNSKPSHPIVPIHNRVEQELNRRREIMRENEEKIMNERQREVTFQPKTLPMSAKLVEEKKKRDPSLALPVQERLLLQKNSMKDEPDQHLVIPKSVNKNNLNDFLKRQDEMKRRAEKRLEKKLNEATEIEFSQANHEIQIAKRRSKQILIQRKPELLQETPEDTTNRLSREAEVRRAKKEEKARIIEQNEYPFRPRISEISKAIAGHRNFDDLIQETRSIVQQQLQESELHYASSSAPKNKKLGKLGLAHDISPANYLSEVRVNTPSPPPRVRRDSIYLRPTDLMKSIEEERRAKEEKTQLLREQQIQNELKECSFRPKTRINTSSETPLSSQGVSNQAIVVKSIPGALRYAELRKRASELEAQKAEREVRAFGIFASEESKKKIDPTLLAEILEKNQSSSNQLNQKVQQHMLRFAASSMPSTNVYMAEKRQVVPQKRNSSSTAHSICNNPPVFDEEENTPPSTMELVNGLLGKQNSLVNNDSTNCSSPRNKSNLCEADINENVHKDISLWKTVEMAIRRKNNEDPFDAQLKQEKTLTPRNGSENLINQFYKGSQLAAMIASCNNQDNHHKNNIINVTSQCNEMSSKPCQSSSIASELALVPQMAGTKSYYQEEKSKSSSVFLRPPPRRFSSLGEPQNLENFSLAQGLIKNNSYPDGNDQHAGRVSLDEARELASHLSSALRSD